MRTWAFRSVILNLIDTCKSKKIKISYLRMARHTVLRKKQRWLTGFSKSIFFVNINRWNKCNYLSKTGLITICLQTHLSRKIWAKMLKNRGFPENHFYLYQIFYCINLCTKFQVKMMYISRIARVWTFLPPSQSGGLQEPQPK